MPAALQQLQVQDAPRRRDPTRTLVLRKAFRAAAEMKLRGLRALLRQAIVERELLGNKSFLAPAVRFRQFSTWFEATANYALVSGWPVDFVCKALMLGEKRANRELHSNVTILLASLDLLDHLIEFELKGIAAALIQKVVRLAALNMDRDLSPPALFAVISQPFDSDTRNRLRAFANYMTVKAYNKAKLEVYRGAGIKRVGVIAEVKPKLPFTDAFDPDQARDPEGKWTSGGSGSSIGHGYSSSAHLVRGVIHTNNVHDATRALYENRKVELSQPKQISVLMEHLHDVVKEMAALGAQAHTFNLCNVTVANTNLFCADTKGIPRAEMPQLDDQQKKDFVKSLKAEGYKVEKTKELSSHLRPTQNEIDGVTIADKTHKMRDKDYDPDRTIVSRDNYILDGHHHWATQIGLIESKHDLKHFKTKIARIDIGIIELLKKAEAFTGGKGHKVLGQRDTLLLDYDEDLVGVRTAGDDLVCQECEDIADDAPYDLDEAEVLLPAHPHCRCTVYPWFDLRYRHDAFNPNQLRNPHGEWTSGSEPELNLRGGENLHNPKATTEKETLAGKAFLQSRAATAVADPELETKNEHLSSEQQTYSKERVNKLFPELKDFTVIAEHDRHYNCVGWAFGDDKRWWWPNAAGVLGSGFWPKGQKRGISVDIFDMLMINKLHGTYSTASEAAADPQIEQLEPGFTKLALFTEGSTGAVLGEPTHMARQMADGSWSSKIGAEELIDHDLHEMDDQFYGSVGRIYRVPTEEWKKLAKMK